MGLFEIVALVFITDFPSLLLYRDRFSVETTPPTHPLAQRIIINGIVGQAAFCTYILYANFVSSNDIFTLYIPPARLEPPKTLCGEVYVVN